MTDDVRSVCGPPAPPPLQRSNISRTRVSVSVPGRRSRCQVVMMTERVPTCVCVCVCVWVKDRDKIGRGLEEVNLLLLGCVQHYSKPLSSLFFRYEWPSRVCVWCFFAPTLCIQLCKKKKKKKKGQWRTVKTNISWSCIRLCVTVNAGTLCSLKASELDRFGGVREEEKGGSCQCGDV